MHCVAAATSAPALSPGRGVGGAVAARTNEDGSRAHGGVWGTARAAQACAAVARRCASRSEVSAVRRRRRNGLGSAVCSPPPPGSKGAPERAWTSPPAPTLDAGGTCATPEVDGVGGGTLRWCRRRRCRRCGDDGSAVDGSAGGGGADVGGGDGREGRGCRCGGRMPSSESELELSSSLLESTSAANMPSSDSGCAAGTRTRSCSWRRTSPGLPHRDGPAGARARSGCSKLRFFGAASDWRRRRCNTEGTLGGRRGSGLSPVRSSATWRNEVD